MNSRRRGVVRLTVSTHVDLGQERSRVSESATHSDALTHPLTITMSYHNRDREWDRGKDYWQQDDYSSWNDGPRGGARGRDDDYYTEGKRRKYNNGVGLLAKHLSQLLPSSCFSRATTARRHTMTMAADTQSATTRGTGAERATTRRGWYPVNPVPT